MAGKQVTPAAGAHAEPAGEAHFGRDSRDLLARLTHLPTNERSPSPVARPARDRSRRSARPLASAVIALAAYVRPQLLVCDEVGHLAHRPDDADVLFHVVDERRRSMVFTANKPLKIRGRVLHDLAEPILDRVLERGCIVTLEGPSMRTRHLDPVPGLSDQETAS